MQPSLWAVQRGRRGLAYDCVVLKPSGVRKVLSAPVPGVTCLNFWHHPGFEIAYIVLLPRGNVFSYSMTVASWPPCLQDQDWLAPPAMSHQPTAICAAHCIVHDTTTSNLLRSLRTEQHRGAHQLKHQGAPWRPVRRRCVHMQTRSGMLVGSNATNCMAMQPLLISQVRLWYSVNLQATPVCLQRRQ